MAGGRWAIAESIPFFDGVDHACLDRGRNSFLLVSKQGDGQMKRFLSRFGFGLSRLPVNWS